MQKHLWIVTLCGVIVGASLLFVRFPEAHQTFVELTIPFSLWPRVFGMTLISAFIANVILSYTTWMLIRSIGLELDPQSSFRASWLLTVTEITLYSLALIATVKELIPIWLAFKAVSIWTGHTGSSDRSTYISDVVNNLRARSRYNLYLFNNAIRIGWGALTYVAILFLIS